MARRKGYKTEDPVDPRGRLIRDLQQTIAALDSSISFYERELSELEVKRERTMQQLAYLEGEAGT